jgi:integrating conjugative element protein (TIGR03752 family)
MAVPARNPENSGSGSDIPIGLGHDSGLNSGAAGVSSSADGLHWVEPKDGVPVDASGRPVTDSNKNNATGFSFATSFADTADAGKQAVGNTTAAVQTQLTDAQKATDPVYTLPEFHPVGSRAMTALLGRIPVDGKVTDPYPFKVMIGKDNLTANGIELPDVGPLFPARRRATGRCHACGAPLPASLLPQRRHGQDAAFA